MGLLQYNWTHVDVEKGAITDKLHGSYQLKKSKENWAAVGNLLVHGYYIFCSEYLFRQWRTGGAIFRQLCGWWQKSINRGVSPLTEACRTFYQGG